MQQDQLQENLPKKTFYTKFWPYLENILYIIFAVLLALLIQNYVVRPFIVNGNSMDPIIKNSQYLIVDEISYRIDKPDRGDVVVFKAPPEPSKYYVKRIIGLPGETIEIKGQDITIYNAEKPKGFTLNEKFIVHQEDNEYQKIQIPENQYFVMGDNRSGSYDSRFWGNLPEKNIKGRALLRLFPFNELSYLPGKINYENK